MPIINDKIVIFIDINKDKIRIINKLIRVLVFEIEASMRFQHRL